ASPRGALPDSCALHGRLTFSVRGPYLQAATAIVIGIDRELASLEQRLHTTIDEFLRRLAAVKFRREFDDDRRLYGPVEHQARITLDLGHVIAVVVDAVAIEGQRRIAEQQHGVGDVALAMLCGRGRSLGRDLRPTGGFAIDDILPLADRGPARRGNGVLD